MPAFDLPTDTLDALATMIGSLNEVAANSSVPGDGAAGKQFFLGKGQCVSCHLVQGEGSPIGPDLSA
jgi:mono/diheme cytochrome c family protein